MPCELYAIRFEGRVTAHVQCPEGDFHADANDASEVPGVLRDGALHAASTGHEVDELVTRSMHIVTTTWDA